MTRPPLGPSEPFLLEFEPEGKSLLEAPLLGGSSLALVVSTVASAEGAAAAAASVAP